jgi:hypothetical protein
MRHPLQHARHAYARRARDLPSVHAVFGEIDSVEQVSAFFKYCFMDEPRERRRRSLRPSAFLILARARPLPCSVQNGGIWEDAVERAICAQDQVVGRLAIPIQTGRAACATAAGNRRGSPAPTYACWPGATLLMRHGTGMVRGPGFPSLPQPSTRSMQHGACRYAKCNLGWPFRALADNASQTACRHYRRVGTIILSTVCAGDCCRCPLGRAASSCERTHAHA